MDLDMECWHGTLLDGKSWNVRRTIHARVVHWTDGLDRPLTLTPFGEGEHHQRQEQEVTRLALQNAASVAAPCSCHYRAIVLSVRVGKTVGAATRACGNGDAPVPILDEIAHNGFCLYRLAPKPLPQLVLVCHGGHGQSKTVAGRDLSFYSKEHEPAVLAADATVKFLSGEGVGFSPDNKPQNMTWGLQTEFIHRNKTVYNYHLYGEGDVIAEGGKKEDFDRVVTPAMDLAFPIPGRRRKLSDFWEFLGWLERKFNVRNLYPMVHCHFCRTPVGG